MDRLGLSEPSVNCEWIINFVGCHQCFKAISKMVMRRYILGRKP